MSESGSFTGRFATFTAHVLATASTPILGPAAVLLASPIADLFKGLAGDHVPSISTSLMQRLRGLDASKLNHDIQKGLLHALACTKSSLIFVYEHPDGRSRELPKKERIFLDALFVQLEKRIKDEVATSSSLTATEGILGGKEGPSSSMLLAHSQSVQEALRRNSPDMERIVVNEFDRHFQLHFSEFLKDKKNSKALVAYEQLTARELLAEVRSLRAELSGKFDNASAGKGQRVPVADKERIHGNIERWMQDFADVDALGKALAPAIEANLVSVTEQLGAMRSMLDSIGDRTIGIEHMVDGTRSNTGMILKLTVVVLVAVLGVGLFFVLDPLHLRSFRLKVEIDGVHDYGAKDRVVKRIAIAYAGQVYDTAEVKEGFASFRIPDEFKNDNASLRLLCQGEGRSDRECSVCDSQSVRLTDLDRVHFPAVASRDTPTEEKGVKNKVDKAKGTTRTSNDPSKAASASAGGAAAPCPLDGLEFMNDGSLEDRVTLSGHSAGTVSISGQVNRKPVDGRLRVNGTTLMAISGAGSLKGGSLSLVQDCRQLKGQLVVLSPSGVQLTVSVNMMNTSR